MKTKKLVMAALLGALAAILMVLDFNVPLAPGFIKFDFSDFPVLIGGFVFGPLTGVLIAFLKIVLNLLFKPTTTMFVGEASNFLLSVCYMGVACLYYRKHRTKGCSNRYGTRNCCNKLICDCIKPISDVPNVCQTIWYVYRSHHWYVL